MLCATSTRGPFARELPRAACATRRRPTEPRPSRCHVYVSVLLNTRHAVSRCVPAPRALAPVPCRGRGAGWHRRGGVSVPQGVRLGDTPWGHGAVVGFRGWLCVCVCAHACACMMCACVCMMCARTCACMMHVCTLVFVHAMCVHACAACVCTPVRAQPHKRAHALFHACPHPRGDLTLPVPPDHSSTATRVPCTAAHAWPLQPLHTQPCTPRTPACPWDAPAALSPRPRGQRNGGRRRGLQLPACLAAQGRAGRAPAAQGMLGAVVPAGAAVPPPFTGPRPCPCPCPWAGSWRRGGERRPRGRCPGPAAPPAAAPTRLLLRHRQRQRPPATPGLHSRPTRPHGSPRPVPLRPTHPLPHPPGVAKSAAWRAWGTRVRGDARVGARLPHAPPRARVRLRAASAHPAGRGPACVCPRVFAVP